MTDQTTNPETAPAANIILHIQPPGGPHYARVALYMPNAKGEMVLMETETAMSANGALRWVEVLERRLVAVYGVGRT
jgi:hypothetical protein